MLRCRAGQNHPFLGIDQRGLTEAQSGQILYALWLIRPTIGKLQILHYMNLSIDVKFGACQLWGVCFICCGVQAIFYHKFLIAHCTNLESFYWFRILIQKYNRNKNERKRLSG